MISMKKARQRTLVSYLALRPRNLICDRIAGGASLRQICQDANMPAKSTIFVWLEEHQDFARLYTLARQMQIEDLMDEILEIADDSSNDWIDREGPDGKK